MKTFPDLYIYNTMSRKKEKFEPLHAGKVSIYCCGITTNGFTHVGHARAFIVFDVIVRFLKQLGYKVNFVRNLTDIDDKVIAKAHEEGLSSIELAKKYIHQFHEDAKALKLLDPTQEPRATEHIEEICVMIEKLLKKELAYEVDGEIFYSIRKFKDYGKLSKKNIEDLESGARIEIGEKKKDPLDFVLWKPAKEGEPSWDSPWGRGRPGWHIECSAMSQKYLGKTFDIHGGGADLIFPHHENEIAQSEGALEHIFANYWLHNGLVNFGVEKMSKSLGNIITVSEFLKNYDAEVMRLWVLSNHYRSPLGFSHVHVRDAVLGLERFYKTALLIDKLLQSEEKKGHPEASNEEEGLLKDISLLEERFLAAMLDDFNTAKALGSVFEVIRRLNQYLNQKNFTESTLTREILTKTKTSFDMVSQVLGIFEENPEIKLASLYELLLPENITKEEVEKLIQERNQARAERNWKRADQIRDKLLSQKIVLEDNRGGTTWRVFIENEPSI
ncbi:MAG: cysteine--tRNA ligase [Deltaproteobacteria bacterium]|nr:cysteine--tRNA ligase [Deltaproteobacteria bacterium]